jgi:hypothetical protein
MRVRRTILSGIAGPELDQVDPVAVKIADRREETAEGLIAGLLHDLDPAGLQLVNRRAEIVDKEPERAAGRRADAGVLAGLVERDAYVARVELCPRRRGVAHRQPQAVAIETHAESEVPDDEHDQAEPADHDALSCSDLPERLTRLQAR